MLQFTPEELRLVKMALHIAAEAMEEPNPDESIISRRKLAAQFTEVAKC